VTIHIMHKIQTYKHIVSNLVPNPRLTLKSSKHPQALAANALLSAAINTRFLTNS